MRVIDDYQIDSENMRVPSRCQRSNSLLGFVVLNFSLDNNFSHGPLLFTRSDIVNWHKLPSKLHLAMMSLHFIPVCYQH